MDRLNLHVRDGEYFTILGPTGAGKTTTLMVIAGLVKPDKGEIHVDGHLLNKVLPEDRGIGFVFQSFELFPHMSVWENVTYGPFVKGLDREPAEGMAKEMLEMVHLGGRFRAWPRELSGGMQQRVALARTLTSGARLLLLDEPLGSLDAKIRGDLRRELRRLVKDLGLTAIHVTHDTEEALTVSDRATILRKGRVLQVGTPREIYLSPESLFVANFIGEANFLEGTVAATDGGTVVHIRDGGAVRLEAGGHGIGDKVIVMVRGENLVMERDVVTKENALYGRIERLKFVRGYIRYEVRLDNGALFVTRQPLFPQRLEEDARVTLSFNPAVARLFSYPEEGLEKAISPE